MITDDERREVAARLRNNALQDMDWMIPWAVFNDAEQHSPEAVVQRLADLIEPSCDRDALLALADDLDYAGAAVENVAYIDQTFHESARRIREALGVEDANN